MGKIYGKTNDLPPRIKRNRRLLGLIAGLIFIAVLGGAAFVLWSTIGRGEYLTAALLLLFSAFFRWTRYKNAAEGFRR